MRKVKSISFNVHDPYEKELFEHAERLNPLTGKQWNFSKYVKKLIENDIRGVTTHTQPQPPLEDSETLEAMSSFM